MDLEIGVIRIDGSTQPREVIDDRLVREYMQVLDVLPPVTVFYDGENYWLADGYHRRKAFMEVGKKKIPVDVRQGDRRAAQLFSLSANATHGARRTDADKRRAALVMLDDPEWGKWSDSEIARRCAVSVSFVGSLRLKLPEGAPAKTTERVFTHPTGKKTVMKTQNIRFNPKVIHENRVTVSYRHDDYDRLKAYAREITQDTIENTVRDLSLSALEKKDYDQS